MSDSDDTIFRNCPHCNSALQVTSEVLRQAEGMLRCGSCLNIFDGYNEELPFIPPRVPREQQHPLAQISVAAMGSAELPTEPEGRPWMSILLAVALGLGLLGQVTWQQMFPDAARSISLAKLVVRPHPEQQQVLRVDAILHNRSHTEQQFPGLHLSFSDRYGIQQAQRSFLPREYLHGELAGQGSIPARSSIQVSLTLRDPGSNATSYSARLQYMGPSSN